MHYEKLFKSSIDNLLTKLQLAANELHLQISIKKKETVFENMVLVENLISILDEMLPNLNSISRYSSLTQHMHFVRYYYEEQNYEAMRSNSEDVVKRDLPIFSKDIRELLAEDRLGSLDEIIIEIESKLRRFIHKKPSSEKDVQDMVENLFVAKDLRYERETVTIPFSTKHYRPDFVLGEYNVAIDIKFCKSSQEERKIIDEINADIIGYKKEYPNVLFIIYDMGAIQHIQKFKGDLENQRNVYVVIIKH